MISSLFRSDMPIFVTGAFSCIRAGPPRWKEELMDGFTHIHFFLGNLVRRILE